MIEPVKFLAYLQGKSINFFCGVPDSLLKDFCAHVVNEVDEKAHVITANEGAAVGMAIGHFLATGNPAMVYMQNSGLGNAVNPLLSLADADVYGVPMLLLIGWRGEIDSEGKQLKDEPQHKKQGRITLALLETMGIKYIVLDAADDFAQKTEGLLEHMHQACEPVAVVVRKGAFSKCTLKDGGSQPSSLSRERAIELIISSAEPGASYIATTGMISRELFELRENRGESHGTDFLTVGGMGHCSQIAFAAALARPDETVYCLDGDGAAIMHLGSLAISSAAQNLKHIVLNNGAHDSVGGQPTCGLRISLSEQARLMGYKNIFRADSEESLKAATAAMSKAEGGCFLEVIVKTGNRPDLGRPTQSPAECKRAFMERLKN